MLWMLFCMKMALIVYVTVDMLVGMLVVFLGIISAVGIIKRARVHGFSSWRRVVQVGVVGLAIATGTHNRQRCKGGKGIPMGVAQQQELMVLPQKKFVV